MSEVVDVRELRLVPVVELEPAQFQRTPVEYAPRATDRSGSKDAEARYWHESLVTAGLGHLEPIVPGSWCVPISQMKLAGELRQLLRAQAWAPEEDEPLRLAGLDEVEPLCGGLVLLDGAQERVSPGCCADLGGLHDWRGAAEASEPSDPSGWDMLWIGHPWASVRREGARLLVRLDGEHRASAGPPPLSLEPSALRRALDVAEAEQRALAERLVPVLGEWLDATAGVQATELALFLAGLTPRPA